jgi:hypothetical protein
MRAHVQTLAHPCSRRLQHYKRDVMVFRSFFHRLNVPDEKEDVSTTSLSTVATFSYASPREGEQDPWVDLDCVIAIDDVVDMLGFDKRWDRLNQTDSCMVISQDRCVSIFHYLS